MLRWLETVAFLVVYVAVALFGLVPERSVRAEDLAVSESPVVTTACPQPQTFEVEDPLEIPLSGVVLWGMLEDSAPYLGVAQDNCLAAVLTETPSGAEWFWIPSWDSWDEKQEILDLFRDTGLEVPWPLSGPHSISVPAGAPPGSSP